MATSNKKNGLIELFRFLCAVWVAYFHGFFPVLSDKFNGVILPVDFFFMVSGFFFLRSIEKYREKPYLEGVWFIFWGRTKRFIVPLIIAFLSICFCNVIFPIEINGFNWPLSFLWFFAAQFVFLSLFYLLLKNINKISLFNMVCVVIICSFLTLSKTLGRPLDIPLRGPAMLAVGMLISQIPKIGLQFKDERKARNLSLLINIIGFIVFAFIFIYLAYLPKFAIWKIHLLCCIVCPAVIYFATAIPVRSKILNLLGEFSVFIYLGQCPILFHHYLVSRDTRTQFPLLCVCAVVFFVMNRIINKIMQRKKA
jgi:peptidoglycan/LPS O-acetylase OafA/YrhL